MNNQSKNNDNLNGDISNNSSSIVSTDSQCSSDEFYLTPGCLSSDSSISNLYNKSGNDLTDSDSQEAIMPGENDDNVEIRDPFVSQGAQLVP